MDQPSSVSSSDKKIHLCRWRDRRRPIVPQGCPCSIVGAEGLNDRVRDGNGCFPLAIVTDLSTRADGCLRGPVQAEGSAASYCPTRLPLQYRGG
jgi:hypothetical protein